MADGKTIICKSVKNTAILVTILLLASCGRYNHTNMLLDKAGAIIVEHPDSSKTILASLDKGDLCTRGQKARHALLYSIALDKTWEDVTTDTIIAPAVDYYLVYGDASDKIKTLYYHGRIYMNSKNYEKAMECFTKAEKHIKRSKDYLSAGRILSAKAAIYSSIHAFDLSLKSSTLASDYYIKAQALPQYYNTILDIISKNIALHNFEEATGYLKICQEHWNCLSAKQQSSCYASYAMIMLSKNEERATIAQILEKYITDIDDTYILWEVMAKAYDTIGQNEIAEFALEKYRNSHAFNPNAPVYNAVMANILETKGNYYEALNYYKTYQTFSGSNDADIFQRDTKFIEERLSKEWKLRHKNNVIIFFCLCTIIAVLASIISIRKQNKKSILHDIEVKNTLVLLSNAQKEIENIKMLKSGKDFDKETLGKLEDRFEIVNNYILETLSTTAQKTASHNLRKLTENPEEFLESTRLSFKVFYPRFIKYLEKTLSEKEIGYCCLICIGLNVAECNAVLKLKSYNYSYNIRKKLGITEQTPNLTNFIRAKFKELK